MADGSIEKAFQEMMVHEAPRDRYLRGALEWLLLGKTDLVSANFIDNVDEAQLSVDVGQYYALGPEGVRRACEICEQDIVKGMTQQGA